MTKIIKYCIRRLIQFVNFLDVSFLHGKLQKKWQNGIYKELMHSLMKLSKGHPAIVSSLNVKYAITFEVATNDLLFLQYASPFINHKYSRFDIPLIYDENITAEIQNDKRIMLLKKHAYSMSASVGRYYSI